MGKHGAVELTRGSRCVVHLSWRDNSGFTVKGLMLTDMRRYLGKILGALGEGQRRGGWRGEVVYC